jgi:hypothetical protein
MGAPPCDHGCSAIAPAPSAAASLQVLQPTQYSRHYSLQIKCLAGTSRTYQYQIRSTSLSKPSTWQLSD